MTTMDLNTPWTFTVAEKGPVRPPLEVHAEAMSQGARCTECPSFGGGRGPVPGELRKSRLTIISEGPGELEQRGKRPLIHWAGLEVMDQLRLGGFEREQTSITMACLCGPPEGLSYTEFTQGIIRKWQRSCAKAEAAGIPVKNWPQRPLLPHEACRPRLLRDIEESESATILTLGSVALDNTCEVLEVRRQHDQNDPEAPFAAPLKRQHGAPVRLKDGRLLLSSYHPSFAGKGKKEWLPVVRENIVRAARFARGDPSLAWYELPARINSTVEEIERWCAAAMAKATDVACDIETSKGTYYTCGIRCVGFWTIVDGQETSIVIPLEHMDGSRWWNGADELRVRAAIRGVLDHCGLIFHNGLFDTTILINHGLLTDLCKTWTDCYVEAETEFLTRRGWLRFDDVRPDEEVATFCGGQIEFQVPTRRHDTTKSGAVFQLETRHSACVVTPNHRMWTAPWALDKREVIGDWNFQSMEKLLAGRCRVVVRVAADRVPEIDETRDFDFRDEREAYAALLGIVATDGCVAHRGDTVRGISVSQEKGGRAEALLTALTAWFPFKTSTALRTEEWRTHPIEEVTWRVDDLALGTRMGEDIGRGAQYKRLPAWIWTAPARERALLFWALVAGDSSVVEAKEEIHIFRSSSSQLIGDVQALAIALGVPAVRREKPTDDGIWELRLKLDAASIDVCAPRIQADFVKRQSQANVTRRFVADERIVCFSVPNETLITRSHGRVAFHGNTLVMHKDTPDNDLPHDLGFCARRKFPLKVWKTDVDHKNVDNANDRTLHIYCGKDVRTTGLLAYSLNADIDYYQTRPQYETDKALLPALREASRLGMVCDELQRGQFSAAFNAQGRAELMKFRELVGSEKFNPRSVPQLQGLLYEQWGYKPPRMDLDFDLDDDSMEDLPVHPEITDWRTLMHREFDAEQEDDDETRGSTSSGAIVSLINSGELNPRHEAALNVLLEYRAFDKLRGTYVDNLPTREIDWAATGIDPMLIGHAPGVNAFQWQSDCWEWLETLPLRDRLSIVNGTLKFGPPTGRLASSAPNLQNIPAIGKANLRSMFVAPPGHILVGADYEQLEARIYAVEAGDALMLDAIATDKDIHSLNAASLRAKSFGEIDEWYQKIQFNPDKEERKFWRTVAKRFVFLEVYGGSPNKLFQVMSQQRDKVTGKLSFPELTPAQVNEWHENFHKLHPECARWQERCAAMQRAQGYIAVEGYDERRRYFLGGVSKKNAVPNMRIQGKAASLANRAVLRLVQEIPFRSWSPWTGFNLQVHDFIGLIVPIPMAERACEILEDCMNADENGVAFHALAGYSDRWSAVDAAGEIRHKKMKAEKRGPYAKAA